MSDIHAEEHDVLVAVGADFSGANGLFEYQLIFAPAPILNSRNLISSAPSRVQRPPLPVSGHNTSRLAIFRISDAAAELGLSSLVQRTWYAGSDIYTVCTNR